MHSVLFVCTGNQYRSPIAAAAFRQQVARDGRGAQWAVSSAGTWTSSGQRAPRPAVEAAQACGLDISSHVTRILDAQMLKDADLILVMEQGHKESIQAEFPFTRSKVYLLSQALEGITYDIPDPAGSPNELQEIVRDLTAMIRSGCGNIYRLVGSS